MAVENGPTLVADKIRKSFGSLEVLMGVSLTANEGDVISILGSSGSGKSTFLRCINLLETPDSGEVTVAGEKIAMRKRRDATLDMPRLIIPSVQINMRAGQLPPAEDNGVTYLKDPVNLL